MAKLRPDGVDIALVLRKLTPMMRFDALVGERKRALQVRGKPLICLL